MAHTYLSLHMHCVFSTAGRKPWITSDIASRLHAYLGGIATEHDLFVHAIGGPEDHVHLLLSLPGTVSVSKVVQIIKGCSSKWIHDTFPLLADFSWQEGFSAFSLSSSHIPDTIAYIGNQVEHHRKRSFQDEYRAFLKRNGIGYDERHLFG